MLKSVCLIFACLFSISHANSRIIFDPIGVDINHPVYSNCGLRDDFTRDPNDDTKFYRCADGWQNSMHCAPGTIFEGMSRQDQLIIWKNRCGYKSGEIVVDILQVNSISSPESNESS
jgi:hypothetical protein